LDDAGDTAPSDDDRELSGWDIQIGAGIQGILIGVAAAGIVAGAFVLVWRAKNRRKTAAGDGAGGE
jgi:hypothetical protein